MTLNRRRAALATVIVTAIIGWAGAGVTAAATHKWDSLSETHKWDDVTETHKWD